jgi:inosine-uridine nucleoside N-ribohydrolase
MKTFAALALLAFACSLPAAEPLRLIFDTDMGNDVDDALALAMIHSLESRGEARLLAVTVTKDNPDAPRFVDIVDTFYGRPNIPIGIVVHGKTPEYSAMIRVPAARRNADGSPVYPRREMVQNAADVLRDTLRGQPDQSVVIVQTGFSTNLARLLESDAQLVKDKVRLLVAMAGAFPTGQPEYNVKTDIPSATRVFSEWPSPIVFSGFEIGNAMLFPAASIEHDFQWTPDHPVVDAYRAYKPMPYDRPTWDLTAVLYAVRPDRDYFSLSPPGRVTADDNGQTHFTESPGGKHRYLILGENQRARTLEALIMLATEPSAGSHTRP